MKSNKMYASTLSEIHIFSNLWNRIQRVVNDRLAFFRVLLVPIRSIELNPIRFNPENL